MRAAAHAAAFLPTAEPRPFFPVPPQVLVLDEADLLLSYGYEEDVRALAPHVPRSAQVGAAAAHAATRRRPVAAHGGVSKQGSAGRGS